MRNQPKYNFFNNTLYALRGLLDIIKTENSFKIELALLVILAPVILLIDASFLHKAIMFMTLMGILVAEAINSAIERVVDLVTLEYSEMAKRAKDVGSAIVFLSITTFCIIWGLILWDVFVA